MKGITPVVTVVLLIALSAMVGISIYYWSAGMVINEPAPNTDVVDISVTAINVTAGTYLVTNVDTVTLTITNLSTNTGNDCAFGAETIIIAGEAAQCTIAGAPTGELVFFSDNAGPATVIVS